MSSDSCNAFEGPSDDQSIADRYLGTRGLNSDATPEALLVVGPPASGKTRWRREHAADHVALDAGDLFWSLGAAVDDDFPGTFKEALQRIGSLVAATALRARRHVVVELLGDDGSPVEAVVSSLKRAGYRTRMVVISCDVEEAIRRNEARGADNISCHFAERFHGRWILAAAS